MAPRLPFDERGGLVVLVDPGRSTADEARILARRSADAGACGFLVGDSLGRGGNVDAHIDAIRDGAPTLAIVQFPASADDLSAHVDAVLFLVLLSGRNPRYLIEEQLRAVPFFEAHPNVGAISTAYLLVDGGRESSVEQVTGTDPLPGDDPALVAQHVRAGQLMGLHATYLEAGSGAVRRIDANTVAAARAATKGPLLVGGGIASAEGVTAARDAGADYVVVGTLFEQAPAADVRTLAVAARL